MMYLNLNYEAIVTTYETWVATGACAELVEPLFRCGCLLIGCTLRGLMVARPENPTKYFPVPLEPSDENDKDVLIDLIEGKAEDY